MVPAPAFVIANAPLRMPLKVKSFAAVPSSATVNNLAAVRTIGGATVAPLLPVPELITVTFPPSDNAPVPVIEEPVVAPSYRATLVGAVVAPKVKVDKANVDPAVTVRAPLIFVLALRVTVFPGLSMVTFAGVFWLRPLPVTWAAFPI
jgi:hypothetical protein